MADPKVFALIEWEDKYVSIISVDTICQPRKEVEKYEEGEFIKAKFKGTMYSAVIAEISDDKKYLEEKKKTKKLKHTFQDVSVASCSSISLPRQTNMGTAPKETAPASSDSDEATPRQSPPATAPTTPLNTTASCSSKTLRPTNLRLTPKKTTPKEIAPASSDSDEATPRQSPPSTAPTTPLNTTGTICSESDRSDSEDLIHTFLSRKSLNKNRDKRKIEELTKDVEELKSEVKKLRKRMRTLEKSKETNGNTNDSSTDPKDEMVAIPDAESVRVSQLIISTKKCFKAPEAVVMLLKKLFSKAEIKDCSISGKKTVKCSEEGPRPPLNQERFRILERVMYEVFPNFSRKELREKIQNVQKVERKR